MATFAQPNDSFVKVAPAKAQSYIAVLEDTLDQLMVLSDITPEIPKDPKKVCIFEFLFDTSSPYTANKIDSRHVPNR